MVSEPCLVCGEITKVKHNKTGQVLCSKRECRIEYSKRCFPKTYSPVKAEQVLKLCKNKSIEELEDEI